MSTSKRRVREVKPKTKTFTGCWTCRGRKVKCDANRPSCLRCEKSGLQCEGYNLKLYWITDEDTVAPSAIKRQAMTLQGSRSWPFQLDEVDRQIALIDDYGHVSNDEQLCSTGPFSVFRGLTDDPSGSHSPAASTSTTSLTNEEDTGQLYRYPESDTDSTFDDRTTAERRGSFTSPTNSWQSENSVVTFGSPRSSVSSASIFEDPVIDRLMKNYVLNVANVLPPLPHPESPYAAVYVPSALVGAASLIFGVGNLGTDLPSSNVAIFYALLATSAFQLRGSGARSDSGFDLIGRSFRAKAFASLQKALEELPVARGNYSLSELHRPSASHVETLLSAMLTFSSMDIMEGSMSEYWIHLEGLERLARQLRKDGKTSVITDRLIAYSSFLSVVASTTSMELPPIAWEDDSVDSSDLEDELFSAHHSLEVTYGITYSLARLMRRIVSRSQNISFYASKDMLLPTSLITACTKLSDEISEWSIDSEPLSELFLLDSERDAHTSLLLARSHLLAFAHSLRVYYHTRILPCSSSEMSHYVQVVAQHLMAIEEIKSEANYDSNVAATITWPGFIASCEAKQGQERDVWRRWWNGMLRHRIGNIPHLWDIVQRAWALRDDEGSTEVPGWMPALRVTGKRVLAI